MKQRPLNGAVGSAGVYFKLVVQGRNDILMLRYFWGETFLVVCEGRGFLSSLRK